MQPSQRLFHPMGKGFNMNTGYSIPNISEEKIAKATTFLNRSAAAWFIIAAIGQVLFAFHIVSFYGGSSLSGDLAQWNTKLYNGIIEGDIIGNLFLFAHILLAFFITVGGLLQIIPYVRENALTFHRWNGRFYILIAFIISIAGLYMVITRGVYGGKVIAMGNFLNAALIMICAIMTLRFARAHNVKAHRRWALRAFLMVSGVWFFRIGFGLWIAVNLGNAPGVDENFQGPFITFLSIAHSLLPLALLELYFWAQDHTKAIAKFSMAATLVVVSIATAVGIGMATMIFWLPNFNI